MYMGILIEVNEFRGGIMEKRKVDYDATRCKGCHLCLLNCPRSAISAKGVLNEKGYEQIQIDDEKCIACGICYSVCPDYALTVTRE